MENLIANSGLQFCSQEVEFNPTEPCMLSSGKMLKYSFAELQDFFTEAKTFDILFPHPDGTYVPVREIRDAGKLEMLANGTEDLDEAGCVRMIEGESTGLFTTLPDGDPSIININSLGSYRLKSPADGRTPVTAFELLVNHWLPMPCFEKGVDGVTQNVPTAWCRMKLIPCGAGSKKGFERYRIVWAFDTTLGDALSDQRPSFYEGETGVRYYSLCNKTELMIGFMLQDGGLSPFAQYIASLLNLNVEKMSEEGDPNARKFIAYYIYLVNYFRLMGFAPEVALYYDPDRDIPVDMVLDIGNSRTCGVLFENGDSTNARMLELRSLTRPWIVYKQPFDMRVVFRKADFGNDIILEEDMFQWSSLVRVGEEARHLVYRSIEDIGLSELTTNYSSPKRYLWDDKPFDGQWKFLTTVDDPFNVSTEENIYVKGISELFAANGSYAPNDLNELSNNYSRSSLITFVFIEVFQQALMQINSMRYRDPMHGLGNVDCRRYLRNVVITCPTAMPRVEQIKLRQAAVNAYDALMRCNPSLNPINIAPSPQALKNTDDYDGMERRQWCYDEASCSQLVYLYAELTQRYDGEAARFFEAKGHVRPEFVADGYTKKALTIGSVDIGAGTTDLMICAYQEAGQGRIVPIPKFWDSFYLAGDDILHNIVQNIILDGPMKGSTTCGSLSSVLQARLLQMTNEQLTALPVYLNPDQPIYKTKIDAVCRSITEQQRETLLNELAINLVRGMFGKDASFHGVRERRCRVDFNTQISVPIAQKFMDMTRQKRASRDLSYDEMFSEVKPSAYLLDFFEYHFGFRFEELVWHFDPEEINRELRHTMEVLMKQLSIVLSAYHCDIVVLSGRPTSLSALPELFVKHYPITPERLVRLEDYRVGTWYPFADPQGYFMDHKSVVAVGGMVGFLASTQGFNGMSIDFSQMIRNMKPTSVYIGTYKSRRQRVDPTLLTPQSSTATFTANVFPAFIGCRQLDSVAYQARPLYAIYNHSKYPSLKFTISRSYMEDREKLFLEEVTDPQGNNVPKNQIELVQQSLVDDGKYWLDKGEFELSLK